MKKPCQTWIVALLLVAACLPAPTPTPPVVTTRLTALLEGELVLVDGCLRVRPAGDATGLLLAWPPDFDFDLVGETVRVTDTLSGEMTEWRLGDSVAFGGGEAGSLDEALAARLPDHCQGPYWVFGGWPRAAPTP